MPFRRWVGDHEDAERKSQEWKERQGFVRAKCRCDIGIGIARGRRNPSHTCKKEDAQCQYEYAGQEQGTIHESHAKL